MIGCDIPKLGNPCELGAQDNGVVVLCHLEGFHVHAVEVYVTSTLPEDLIVGQN